jgi:hypothetical protein
MLVVVGSGPRGNEHLRKRWLKRRASVGIGRFAVEGDLGYPSDTPLIESTDPALVLAARERIGRRRERGEIVATLAGYGGKGAGRQKTAIRARGQQAHRPRLRGTLLSPPSASKSSPTVRLQQSRQCLPS